MKVKGMIESDVDTFKVGDVIEVKLADGVKVQAISMTLTASTTSIKSVMSSLLQTTPLLPSFGKETAKMVFLVW